MPRFHPAVTNFNRGEWSDRMAGRPDVQGYKNACRVMLNAVPMVQGGWTRRPGTRFVDTTKSNADARLVKFVFNKDQKFLIEAGANYIRWIDAAQKAQIEVATTAAAITNGAFGTNITGWTNNSTGTASISHDATNLRMILTGAAASIARATQAVTVTDATLHVLCFRVYVSPLWVRVGTSAGGEQLRSNVKCGVGWHCVSFTSSGTTAHVEFRNEDGSATVPAVDDIAFLSNTPLELVSPWGASDIGNIRTLQQYDTLYVACSGVKPYKILRRSNTSWSIEEVDFKDGPYLPQNSDETNTLTLSGVTVNTTVTVTAAKAGTFASTDVGRSLRIAHPQDNENQWNWGVITAFSTSQSVSLLVKRAFNSTSASHKWRLGAFGGGEGYPAIVTMYEDRLFWARTTNKPQTVWGSVSQDWEHYAPTTRTFATSGQNVDRVADDSSLAFTLNSEALNPITWLAAGQVLLGGSAEGEFTMQASTLNDPLTPTNASAKPQTTKGAADATITRVDNRVLFVQDSGRKLIELVYDAEISGYAAGDATLYADHMLAGVGARVAWQREPHTLVWVACEDGSLRSLCYNPQQQVLGWSRHTIAGTAMKVLDVACVPGDRDSELWLIVERTIDGGTKRYIEYLANFFNSDYGDDLGDAIFVDSCLYYSGAGVTTITGLGHLEGQSVRVLGNGKDLGSKTVSGGQITGLSESVTYAAIGLGYTSDVETMPNAEGSQSGSAIGRRSATIEHHLHVVDTIGLEYGRIDSDNVEWMDTQTIAATPALYSGRFKVGGPSGFDDELTFRMRQSAPYPTTVVGVFPTVVVND